MPKCICTSMDWLGPMFSTHFMHVLVTCKNECDSIKNEGARVVNIFPHYKYLDFFRRSSAVYYTGLSPIWSNFELVRDVMNVPITCQSKLPRPIKIRRIGRGVPIDYLQVK